MSAALDVSELKERMRRAWSVGDYSKLAERMTWPAAPVLVDACAISAGQEVLDVAAGNGNVAVAAAETGARVVASDLTPALIELGRERARADGLEIEWVEADAEELPFPDASFDCVTSVFGAMFAPRPDVVARELFRVVRPGNTVGMANWTPEGFSGRLFALTAEYVPPADGVPRPTEWGEEETVRRRFDGLAGTIELERKTIRSEFESGEALVTFLEQYVGPHMSARAALSEDRYAELRERLLALIAEWNLADDGSVALESEYLQVVARKRG